MFQVLSGICVSMVSEEVFQIYLLGRGQLLERTYGNTKKNNEDRSRRSNQ
jgi:hypothetical protein